LVRIVHARILLRLASLVLPLGLAGAGPGGSDELPYTVPEASAWRRTSTSGEVQRFLEELRRLPHAERLTVASMGRSHEGKELSIVLASDPPIAQPDARAAGQRLRVLVNANIHGGEVEGKEAVQILLREIAHGRHAELLREAAIVFVPVFNPDGNDRISPSQRVNQNGPDGGVGERANAQGLDLNRDFVKLESPECAALLSLANRFDPELFLDLHTTNGSAHGYHLTYAPSLATNVDPALDAYARERLLPAVRAALLAEHGFRVFDYGNFDGRGERSWSTYDHRPRFGTNYFGLRNRVAVLSEAYSNLDLRERVEVTRAFVRETIAQAVASRDELRAAREAAEERIARGEADFAWDSVLEQGRPAEVLVGEVRDVVLEGLGTRHVAEPVWRAETMKVRDRFVARARAPLPEAWVLTDPPQRTREVLRRHGLWIVELTEPAEVAVDVFVPRAVRRAARAFQGHHEVALEGEWRRETRQLPVGTWVVSARQPLARVAAQLLEPLSEDSLATWSVLDETLEAEDRGQPAEFPVVRLVEPAAFVARRVPAYGTPAY